jgi:hypothetical protein
VQRRKILVPAKAGRIGKGIGEDGMIHTRIHMTHKQLVVARIVAVVINDNAGAGDMVEFMVGYVAEFMKEC